MLCVAMTRIEPKWSVIVRWLSHATCTDMYGRPRAAPCACWNAQTHRMQVPETRLGEMGHLRRLAGADGRPWAEPKRTEPLPFS